MAQLTLFAPTSTRCPAASSAVGESADGRSHPYRVPIYRVTLVRESSITAPAPRLRGAQQAAELLRQYLGAVDREHFVVILLDRKNTPIGINTVSIGSLTASVVHMRETFKAAILANAAAILCGHNHPSGDPEPSREDRVLTQRLVDAGKLLGIPLVDHVVIGDGTTASFSFADQGLL
jgi:DNA repair protein RadC